MTRRCGSGGNPPTRFARFTAAHQMRTPARKVVRSEVDEWGCEHFYATCGHEVSAKGAVIGKNKPCTECLEINARALGYTGP